MKSRVLFFISVFFSSVALVQAEEFRFDSVNTIGAMIQVVRPQYVDPTTGELVRLAYSWGTGLTLPTVPKGLCAKLLNKSPGDFSSTGFDIGSVPENTPLAFYRNDSDDFNLQLAGRRWNSLDSVTCIFKTAQYPIDADQSSQDQTTTTHVRPRMRIAGKETDIAFISRVGRKDFEAVCAVLGLGAPFKIRTVYRDVPTSTALIILRKEDAQQINFQISRYVTRESEKANTLQQVTCLNP